MRDRAHEGFIAAAVQMVSGDHVDTNLTKAADLIAQAADAGAKLVVLPENFAFMGRYEGAVKAVAEPPDGPGQIQQFLAAQALAHGLVLVGGSVPLSSTKTDKIFASSLVYGPDGRCMARYDKLHLFDVQVGDQEGYKESATFTAGNAFVTVDTPFAQLGLSICYDLRFPELYRQLTQRGAELLLVPSAFTATTGAAHWSTLLRARAVENLSHVVAPNQGGVHASGRATYGHSMIIDPWGRVLACQTDSGAGVITAKIDLAEQQTVRQQFPALSHARIGIAGMNAE